MVVLVEEFLPQRTNRPQKEETCHFNSIIDYNLVMHNSHENEQPPMKNVSVGLYGHTADESLEEKIAQIQAFLTKNGGTCNVLRKPVNKTDADLLIEFHANIPEWFVNQHHAFDSVLNSTTNGFGVAWVEDIN